MEILFGILFSVFIVFCGLACIILFFYGITTVIGGMMVFNIIMILKGLLLTSLSIGIPIGFGIGMDN